MNIHEQGLTGFVVAEKQQRVVNLLSSSKKRDKILGQLSHCNFLDEKYTLPIANREWNVDAVYRALRLYGAPETCHVISQLEDIDGSEMALLAALTKIIGSDYGTILSCIPGKLGYYEGEDTRFILKG